MYLTACLVFYYISSKLASAMAVLASSFVLLTALVNSVFYIYHPKNAESIFICLNKTNESWPENWSRMYSSAIDGGTIPIFSLKLPENVTEYKIRIFYINRTHGDSGWKNFTLTSPSPPPPSLQQTPLNAADDQYQISLYYIVFVVTVLLLKLLLKIFFRHGRFPSL